MILGIPREIKNNEFRVAVTPEVLSGRVSILGAGNNIPGIYTKTSTLALTNLTLPYIKKIADGGFNAIIEDTGLMSGLNIHNSEIGYLEIAEDLDMMDKFKEFKKT